jgi:uncharacterized membrane protein
MKTSLENFLSSVPACLEKLGHSFSIESKPSGSLDSSSYSSAKNKKAIVFFLLFWGCLAVMAVLKNNNIHSTYFDMGVFFHNISQISNGEWPRIFLSHIQPFVAFWSILHIFFHAETIATLTLISQAGLLALPIIGIYRYFGAIPSLAFLLYFPLWYNGLFDFHIDHLSVPILFSFFFFEREKKIKLALLFAFLLALVKEPFALQTAFCGIYLLLKGKHLKEGIILVFYGLLVFFIEYQYFLVYFNSFFIFESGSTHITSVINSPFQWLGANIKEIIIYIITQPHKILLEIFTNKDKIVYLLYTFGALGFIPLLKPKVLVVTIPIFSVSLLSSLPSHHSYMHHYTAGLIAPMIIAFAEGLPKAKDIWGELRFKGSLFYPVLISGLFICHFLSSPSPIGRKFFQEKSWNYHYSVYLPSNRDTMIKAALSQVIPVDPEVVVSMQNTLVLNSLMQRKITLIFPGGAVGKIIGVNTSNLSWSGFLKYVLHGKLDVPPLKKYWADYVILDLKRPWFIVDRGCHWLAGRCLDDPAFESEFLGLVEKTQKYFDPIFENDGFIILKRKTGTASAGQVEN